MRLGLLVIVLFLFHPGFSQTLNLTQDAEVSVLTFGPGESLNDAFGHNAFRITDKSRGFDLVYGYGEYDFDAPFFYLKFAQGKLNYLISRHRFSDIFDHYSRNNRSIDEQVLNLNASEKQKLFDYLENNYKPENRRYLYDFFYDNCATRIRDVAEMATNNKISYTIPKDFEPKTFRKLIHDHVKPNSWGGFGIDLALGSIIDQKASAREHMFLPKYIHDFFGTAQLGNGRKLVKNSSQLYEKKQSQSQFDFLWSPVFILGLLSLFIIFKTYKDHKTGVRSRWVDISLASFTGIIGIVLFLLWFATNHSTTAYNYNLLWAFPLNMILIRQLGKETMKKWVKGYLKFLIIMLCLMTLHWLIGVQVFAIGLIPLLIALGIRYVYLIKNM
ncbi:lipoprotein N-acyltransferase Lnb domain-containing protein [Winogradskyella aurantia]|uniref:Uncharacterized protein n=1 Tax=Winogradskyella aurantia TaxID=1915063 RepID=A0A265UQU3_9FLAO|nr:DUF4105 domain-containing protein [Winogradskyella aurantia]OZV67592.1 hypothetical protein CA834_11625 [Winogradskyella aurantia]